MPASIPQSVQAALGEAAADFARWFEENLRERAVSRDEYREVLSRLDVIERDIGGINERLDRMDERFDRRFDPMETRFNQIDARFDNLNHRMVVQTRWMGAPLRSLLRS